VQLSVSIRWGRVELIGTGKCAIVIGTGKRAALLGDSTIAIDLIHEGRHVEFAIIVQIGNTILMGQTTQGRAGDYNEHFSHTDDLFHVH